MHVGVADYGMMVWDGGLFDLDDRLLALQAIGYEGIERLTAVSEADALYKAFLFRRHHMAFHTCRGPEVQAGMRWTAALGKDYVWVEVQAKDLDGFCRQARLPARIATKFGIRVGIHNHLGSPVESQTQLEAFLSACPDAGLILDTGHLAAAGGDPLAIIRTYAARLVAVHVKDWLVTRPEVGLDRWFERGRFCELGAGNIGQDHVAVVNALQAAGYDGWIFVEQDTHLRESVEDLAHSRDYLRRAGV